MVEAIQCPSCQTKYGLRPARVRSGLRRAQCFRCGDVFHIELEVKRLLTPEIPKATANLPLESLAEAIHQAPESPRPSSLEATDLALTDLELPDQEPTEAPAAPAFDQGHDQSWPGPSETAPIPSMVRVEQVTPQEAAPESAADSELASFELPSLPEAEPTLDIEPGGTYASAKEAISRLFGDTPMAPSPMAKLRNALDMTGGMEALDNTLGGTPTRALSTQPVSAPVPEAPSAPMDLPPPPADLVATPMEEEDLPHASPTLRMSATEVASATGNLSAHTPEPPEITQEEVTMVLPPASPLPASDPSALRLRIGDQVYEGLDLPTIAKWIEEGRVLEDHQVTRGMSENWMDASKIPALRPVFERLRRSRLGEDFPAPPSVPDTGQMKRGLFGGMFGKKE